MFENDASFESFTPGEEAPGETELTPTIEETGLSPALEDSPISPAFDGYSPQEIETLTAAEGGITPMEVAEEGLTPLEVAEAGITPMAEEGLSPMVVAEEGLTPTEVSEDSLPAAESYDPYSNEIASMENESALHTEEVTETGANQFDETLTEE